MSKYGNAVVTGASAGTGKIYADRLAKAGYDLTLIARRGDKLIALQGELQQMYGVQVSTLTADLTSPSGLNAAVEAVSNDPQITILVNNAGTSTLGSTVDSKPEEQDAMIGLNVVALTRLTVAILTGFKERNKGTIINIGSVLGFASLPISTIYSGTKGYVHNFTRGLQDELARHRSEGTARGPRSDSN